MLTLILFLLPLLAGTLLLLNKQDNLGKTLAVSLSLIQVGLFAYIYCTFTKDVAALSFNKSWLGDFGIAFHLGFDGLSVLMVGLTVVATALIIFAIKDFNYGKMSRLLGLVLLTEAALIGLFTAKDAFLFYFFFEIALIPVYLIANLWGGAESSKITLKMFIYTVFGSLFMLVTFVVFYYFTQTGDLQVLATVNEKFPLRPSLKNLLFWGFFIAFAIKMPLFLVHGWQPDAYSQSPTPATMLLSALLSKMGVYGLIRIVLPLTPDGLSEYAGLLIYLAIVGLIYGSIIAIQQLHIKRLIAYSSFAHMGLMAAAVMTLSKIGVQGAIFQMVAHGLSAVGLFYVAKIIFEKTGSRNLQDLGGIAQKAPKLAVMFLIVLLGSVGLPLTNGFVGEFLMLKSVFDYNNILGAVATSSIILGAVYLLRLFQKTMYGPMSPKTENIEDIGIKEMTVLVPIALVILITGVFPNLILDISAGFVDQLVK